MAFITVKIVSVLTEYPQNDTLCDILSIMSSEHKKTDKSLPLTKNQDDSSQPLILCHLFLSISLNLSSSTILVEIFPNALKRATISFLVNLRSFFTDGKPARIGLSNSPENRILRAVPNPVTLRFRYQLKVL